MSKRPIALEDLFRFRLAGDAQMAPDGRRIVFTVKRVDAEKNKYFTSLWMADTETAESRPFTADGHSDTSPRWSPDGRQIAFLSDRNKPGTQIFLIPADGGEARALTTLPEGGIESPVWSPDGSRIAFLYRATPEDRTEKVEKERQEKEFSSPVRVHRKLFYRLDGFGYFDDSYWQVWVVDVHTGEAKALTDEPHHHQSPAWSPDGRTVAFIANRSEDDDLEINRDDIWTIPAEGGEIHRVEAPAGPKSALAWSPDGRMLAYIGHTDPDATWGGRNERVLVVPAEGAAEVPDTRTDGVSGSPARDLTGDSDRAVGYLTLSDLHDVGGGVSLRWSPDGRTLYFPISERGDTRLYRVNADGTGLTALTPPNHEMSAFSLSADGSKFGIVLGNATDMYDVWAGVPSGDEGRLHLMPVSDLNKELLDEIAMQMPEPFEIPNSDDGTVHGWLLRPPDFNPSKEYPCVLYVHGGPALQYGGQAAPFHELQWLAANGYVVLFSNPRGSKGYGEAHTSAIKGDWGNRDWIDIQAVADYGAALPYVDADRMGIMGGSYGGYMTAWAVGHTDRFACAIADRLVGNLHSMSGTCDFPWQHGKEFPGNAWDDPAGLWRVSPLAFAGKINTPLLLIHSDGDLRCPVGQAEELFAALRMQRKTVEFVRFPASSSHGLSRNGPPDLRLERLRRNLAWLDRYLKR